MSDAINKLRAAKPSNTNRKQLAKLLADIPGSSPRDTDECALLDAQRAACKQRRTVKTTK